MSTDLVVFEGFRYRNAAEWAAAFAEFRAARDAWAQQNEGAALPPYEVNGYCPFDKSRFRKSTTDAG